MAIVAGALIGEEILKDVVIPWWVSSQIIGGASVIVGATTGAIVSQISEGPSGVAQVQQQMEELKIEEEKVIPSIDVEADAEMSYNPDDYDWSGFQGEDEDVADIQQSIQQQPEIWALPPSSDVQMIFPDGNDAGDGGNDPDPNGGGYDAMEIVKQVDEVLPTAIKIGEVIQGKPSDEKVTKKEEQSSKVEETPTPQQKVEETPKSEEKQKKSTKRVDLHNIFSQTLSQKTKLNTRKLK